MSARWFPRLWRTSTGRFGLIVIAIVALAAVVSLFWTPFDPRASNIGDRWLPPGWPHLLGTDDTGRDILSLLMAGARTTVFVSVGAGLVATVVGIALAALGALTTRLVRETVAAFVDILIAFPVLLIAMMISSVWGGSLWVVIWAVGIGFGVNIARVTRPELRRVQQSDFVLAARASGLTPAQSLVRHLLRCSSCSSRGRWPWPSSRRPACRTSASGPRLWNRAGGCCSRISSATSACTLSP